MSKHLTLLVVPFLAACATVGPETPGQEQGQAANSACRSDQLGQFAGRPATADLGREILQASGASNLQWVAHGTMVTMEYRADRVRVWLDEANRVSRANCG